MVSLVDDPRWYEVPPELPARLVDRGMHPAEAYAAISAALTDLKQTASWLPHRLDTWMCVESRHGILPLLVARRYPDCQTVLVHRRRDTAGQKAVDLLTMFGCQTELRPLEREWTSPVVLVMALHTWLQREPPTMWSPLLTASLKPGGTAVIDVVKGANYKRLRQAISLETLQLFDVTRTLRRCLLRKP